MNKQKYIIYPDQNSLTHHGVKGMKWGIRRYQNSDGTLTAEGKRKYGNVQKLERSIEFQKEVRNINDKFKASDKKNLIKTKNEYYSKMDNVFIDGVDKVKKSDPNIGAVYLLDNGLSQTSFDIDKSLKSGAHIMSVRWICDGETMEKTLDMIETVNKNFGNNELSLQKIAAKYSDEARGALLRDIGEEDTKEGRAYIKNLGLL